MGALLDRILLALFTLPHLLLLCFTIATVWLFDEFWLWNSSNQATMMITAAGLLSGSIALALWSVAVVAPALETRKEDWEHAFSVYYDTVVGRWSDPAPLKGAAIVAEAVTTAGISLLARGLAAGARSARHRTRARAAFAREVSPAPLNTTIFLYLMSLSMVAPFSMGLIIGVKTVVH